MKKTTYSAKLENGSAKVFYDCNGTKTISLVFKIIKNREGAVNIAPFY